MKKILLSTLATIALMQSSVHADAITDQLNEVIKMYEDKDYKASMDELKFITAEIQKLDSTENQKLLPAPLEGWSVENGDNGAQVAMSMLGGGGTSMQATYKKGKESIEIQILANSPMLAMMAMAINNPALMSADPSTTPYRYKRNKGVKKINGTQTEITLLISGQIMIKLDGDNLVDDKVLETYLDAIDIKKLKMNLL
jgi:hypothetical protein